MRVALITALGVCFVLSPVRVIFGQVAPQNRLTEAQALQQLSTSDPRLRAARARLEELRAAQIGRALWANPTFTFSRESVGDAHDDFLLARQELDVSGRLTHLRAAGRLAVDAAAADARYQVVQLQAAVRDGFTVLLLAQEREATLAEGLKELQKLLDILRTREQQGEGSRYDRMRGQRALAEMEADLGTAAAVRAEAQGRLTVLLGGPPAETLSADGRLELPPHAPDLAMLVERALASRSDLQALTTASSQFRAEQSAAGRLAVPVPALSGGLRRSGVGNESRSGYVLSLDLSVPVFNRGQSAAAVASALLTGVEAQAMLLRHQIEAEVRTARAVFEIHRQKAERYLASTAGTADDLFIVARLGYDEGELGILELLDALRQSLDRRARMVEMSAAVRRAAIELDRVIGVEIKP